MFFYVFFNFFKYFLIFIQKIPKIQYFMYFGSVFFRNPFLRGLELRCLKQFRAAAPQYGSRHAIRTTPVAVARLGRPHGYSVHSGNVLVPCWLSWYNMSSRSRHWSSMEENATNLCNWKRHSCPRYVRLSTYREAGGSLTRRGGKSDTTAQSTWLIPNRKI